jgi:hypothetical protein
VTSSCGIGSEGLFATSGPVCTLSEKQASGWKVRGCTDFLEIPIKINITSRDARKAENKLLLYGRWGQPPRYLQPSVRIAVERLCVVSSVAGLRNGFAEIIILLINMWNH